MTFDKHYASNLLIKSACALANKNALRRKDPRYFEAKNMISEKIDEALQNAANKGAFAIQNLALRAPYSSNIVDLAIEDVIDEMREAGFNVRMGNRSNVIRYIGWKDLDKLYD